MMSISESIRIWKITLAISSALVVIVWSLFCSIVLETVERQAASHLGYRGAAIRLVAIPTEISAPATLSAALSAFARDHGASIAHSRSSESALVTILDDGHTFFDGERDMSSMIGDATSGKTAAVSIDAVNPTTGQLAIQLPDDTTVTGFFDAHVTFEDRYPAAIFSPEALPFTEGIYLITADGGSPSPGLQNATVEVFQSNGMDIVELSAIDSATVPRLFIDLFGTPFGVVFLLFAGFVVVSQILVTAIHARLLRGRLVVAATLGAPRRALRWFSRRSLLTLVLPGLATGTAIGFAMALGGGRLSLVDIDTRLLGATVASLAAAGVSMLTCWLVAWLETRRVASIVVC